MDSVAALEGAPATGGEALCRLGLDIGGTLAKLVIFEPAGRSDESMAFMPGSVVGRAVARLASAIPPVPSAPSAGAEGEGPAGSDGGGNSTIFAASHHPIVLPGRGILHFRHFETWRMEQILPLKDLTLGDSFCVGATGGGARKFEKKLSAQLGAKIHRADEFTSLLRGIDLLALLVVGDCFTFPKGAYSDGAIQKPQRTAPTAPELTISRTMTLRRSASVGEGIAPCASRSAQPPAQGRRASDPADGGGGGRGALATLVQAGDRGGGASSGRAHDGDADADYSSRLRRHSSDSDASDLSRAGSALRVQDDEPDVRRGQRVVVAGGDTAGEPASDGAAPAVKAATGVGERDDGLHSVYELEGERIVPVDLHGDDGGKSAYPYLVINIGSGVSILKVSSSTDFVRVGGTSLGGSTFLGLCSALTGCSDFAEAIALASRGDSTKVDMLVGDIYGGDYPEFNLSATTVASSFGKLVRPSTCRQAEVQRADLAKAALLMVTNNVGSLALLHAKAAGARRVLFAGSFLRGNVLAMKLLAVALEFWSRGDVQAVFLCHIGHAGAIGALLSTLDAAATQDSGAPPRAVPVNPRGLAQSPPPQPPLPTRPTRPDAQAPPADAASPHDDGEHLDELDVAAG